MSIRPLHDRVLIRRLESDKKTPGGIVIPDSAAEKPMEGEVVSVGNGKLLDNGELRALEVKAGDKILFGKYSGTEVKVDGEELIVMRELVAVTYQVKRCMFGHRARRRVLPLPLSGPEIEAAQFAPGVDAEDAVVHHQRRRN